mgnify:CR=1 FL=1
MPRYRSRSKSRERKARKTARAKIPREKRKLLHWAAKGTKADYERLRKHAHKALMGGGLPGYLEPLAMEDLSNATRATLTHALHKPQAHMGGGLADSIAHLLDKVPGHSWSWKNALTQAALRPFRGDSLTEQDELYARLVKAGYHVEAERPDEAEGYTRQKQFDGKYVSVWDSPDNHRMIVVRGTKPTHGEDWAQNARIMMHGKPHDLVGDELQHVLEQTPSGTVIDVASHSLGTSLTLEAYTANPGMQNRIHQTFLYNPAYTVGGRGSTNEYERDKRVRYFINSGDIVSLGSLGSSGPVNMVLRHPHSLNPMAAHTIDQWFGHEAQQAQVQEEVPDFVPDPDRDPGIIRINADPRTLRTQEFETYDKGDDG